MAAVVTLAFIFLVLAVAGIAGWCVDSRDSRFSLWPLNRDTPNHSPGPDPNPLDASEPAPPVLSDAKHPTVLPEHRNNSRPRTPHGAPGRRPVHLVHPTPQRRYAVGHAVTPSHPSDRTRKAAQP
jgi:hypothetical protein